MMRVAALAVTGEGHAGLPLSPMLAPMVRLTQVFCSLVAGLLVALTVLACGSSAHSPASAPAPVSAGWFTFFSLPKALSDPDKIEAGPDGALWLTQKIGHPGQLGRITTAGAASTVALPAGSEPTAVTIGPDQALWYSAIGVQGSGLGRVGRVSAEHDVREVSLSVGNDVRPPSAAGNAFVDSIATGSDGALWFTSFDLVGRLVPGQTMTFFPIAGAEELAPIVAGPDGALWTTDVVPAIWRITTSGSIRRFSLPTQFGAHDLAFAGDGALWFTSQSSPLVGRRAQSGRITFFRLADEAKSITMGPDDALWFTSSLAINRITAGGEITQLDIPETAREARFPAAITTGPDGTIWFTLRVGNRGGVGRIDIAALRRKLLVARLSDHRLRGQPGRRLRITFHATQRATGVLRLSRGGHTASRRSIRANRGANTIALRLPRRSGTHRLELRLQLPGQSASDSTPLRVAP
jgi:virginiamycin B lyase